LYKRDYGFFTNQLKINISNKNYYFDTYVNTDIKKILEIYYKLGVVRRFSKISTKKYRIYINWVGEHSTIKSIKFFQKTNPIRLTYKSLLLINLYTFNSNFLLETNKGLITHNEALRFKIGGNLVCLVL
jgi:ribosomal protein S8